MILLHIGIASLRQLQHVPTACITEKINVFLKLTLIKYHAHCICLSTTCQAASQC